MVRISGLICICRDKNGVQKCINMYDIRLKEEDSPYCGLSWPYELDDVTKYLRVGAKEQRTI